MLKLCLFLREYCLLLLSCLFGLIRTFGSRKTSKIFPSEPSAVAHSAILVCVGHFYSSALLTTVSAVLSSTEERGGKETNLSFSEKFDLNVVVFNALKASM